MSTWIDRIRRALGNDENEISERAIAGRRVLGTTTVLRQVEPDYDDAWLFALASHHFKIMDIGANRGFTALLASLAGEPNTKELLLVDANAAALGVACQNLTMNGFGKGIVFQQGLVSDKVGEEIEFFTIGAGDAGSIYQSHAKSASKKRQSRMLKTTTVDALATEHDFTPDLVKIDVEGAELDVLKGAVNVARSGAAFFIEMHALDSRPMVESAKTVIEWSRANDRTAYYMKKHAPLVDPQEVAHRGRFHLLILPNDRSYPEYLKPIPQRSPIPD